MKHLKLILLTAFLFTNFTFCGRGNNNTVVIGEQEATAFADVLPTVLASISLCWKERG